MPPETAAGLAPGLLVLHGNRVEDLAATVFGWLAREPLAPLEEERFLVPSNGMAEWLKMEAAAALGVCAAMRFELPARFAWQVQRAVLGRAAVPAASPLDKAPLAWRLMHLLPALAGGHGAAADTRFEPLARWLGPAGEAARRWPLAARVADVFDALQVYRGDWLEAWAEGRDTLDPALSLPEDLRWLPALWRAVLASLPDEQRLLTRPALQRRFLAALAAAAPGTVAALPRRVVLFGSTQLPQSLLVLLDAVARHAQVILAVPNPCRWFWADIIEGHELLRAPRERQPRRTAAPAGHPLLAAWGRQARDFVRALDAYDDVRTSRARFAALPRVDLFDEGDPLAEPHALARLQAEIREGLAREELPCVPPREGDRSIVLHDCTSAMREVEVLHDQLLHLLATEPGLAPRDIVVMVPAIETHAAAIHAVFGGVPRHDTRHIPYGISDLAPRASAPLVAAVQWLLALPRQRVAYSEIESLLEVPALARAIGLAEADRPQLLAWLAAAGHRWGLDAAQRERASPGSGALGEVNTAVFARRRLLLGYAMGAPGDGGAAAALAEAAAWPDPPPEGEVGGLASACLGAFTDLLDALGAWSAFATGRHAPQAWAAELRLLLSRLFSPGPGSAGEAEREQLAALDDALAAWLAACERGGFDEPVDARVVASAWFALLDAPERGARVRAGGVTFCTLLPLRAIPFQVVCLLGLNDGEYPRPARRDRFDPMGLPGQSRAGDRSRRDDDRQLMLDALLAARRVLYLSWVGRSARDQGARQPSVLLAQLRDHLVRTWGEPAVAARCTRHPLAPFARRLFEAAPGGAEPFSHAIEWRRVHDPAEPAPAPAPTAAVAAPAVPDAAGEATLTLDELARWLKNPVRSWFASRLGVTFEPPERGADDHEPFGFDALERWQVNEALLAAATEPGPARAMLEADAADADADAACARARRRLDLALDTLARSGRWPLGAPGRALREQARASLVPLLERHARLLAAHPELLPPEPLRMGVPGTARLLARIDGQRRTRHGTRLQVHLTASRPLGPAPKARKALPPPKAAVAALLPAWLRHLAAAAAGAPAETWVLGPGGTVRLPEPSPEAARAALQDLLDAWCERRHAPRPWPTALRTGLALLEPDGGEPDPEGARRAFEGNGAAGRARAGAEGAEAALNRLFPTFDALVAEPGFEAASRRLYAPLVEFVRSLPDDALERIDEAVPTPDETQAEEPEDE